MVMAIVGLLPPGHYDYVIVPGLSTLTSYLDLRMLSTWWLSERKFPVATKASFTTSLPLPQNMSVYPRYFSQQCTDCLSYALIASINARAWRFLPRRRQSIPVSITFPSVCSYCTIL